MYIVDWESRVGTKPGKQRPCIAIQPSECAQGGLKSTVIAPLTTNLTKGGCFSIKGEDSTGNLQSHQNK